MDLSKYEMMIGIEVHVELNTESKMFCSCPTRFGALPNTQCCPVCMGFAGSLPTINEKAIEYAVKAGLVTNCKITPVSGFDRKNYFYPDLPKGYQITQYFTPICRDGYIDIDIDGGKKRIGIARIHMEEDAGKLIHDREGGTLIDHNRAGVPLIEIVSKPDMSSSDEAKAYLKKLRSIIRYIGISDCKMNEGSFRCDVNISVRPLGTSALGVKTELKNLNSFAFAAKAIDYEFERQAEIIASGKRIEQETRRFNETDGKTYSMRSKETDRDYRYFPEPDLPSVVVTTDMQEKVLSELPRLPDDRISAYVSEYGMSYGDSSLIASDRTLADFFEEAAGKTKYVKKLANIIISELIRVIDLENFESPVSADNISELSTLIGEETINMSVAKKLLKRMCEKDESPRNIVEREALAQINDADALLHFVSEAIEENPKAVADFRAGRTVAAKTIIGKVMSKTDGRANPTVLNEIVINMLSN